VLAACGAGDGSGDSPVAIASTATTGAPTAASPPGGGPPLPTPTASAPPPVAPVRVVLPRPVLQFNDTGISVTDGLTFNGRWSVGSLLDGLGREYSLDQGRTWIRGAGDPFTPTALPRWEGTLLLHGEISRPDMDFVRFDVPPGQRLRSLRLVHYD
jgi:hypothetical protein